MATQKSMVIDISAAGDTPIVTGVPGQHIRVINLVLVPDATVAVQFKSSGGTLLTGAMKVTTQGLVPGFSSPHGPGWKWPYFSTVVGEDLVLTLGTGVHVAGWLNYILEPV
jgi:hypothetical protein